MIRLCVLVYLAAQAASCAQAAGDAPSGYRAALLLGNSKYDGFTLSNAAASLDEVGKALTAQGFRVVRHENLSQQEMKSTLEEFSRSLPTNGVAVVYYTGLAAHVERLGKWYNLLRPVGEKIGSDNDYRSRGLNVADAIKLLAEQSGSRSNLLFLDACWQSPIKPASDKVHGGLREFDTQADTVVMFAAGSGMTLAAPKGYDASPLASSLSRNVQMLETSVGSACDAIASAGNKPWFAGATASGLGKRSNLPVTETPGDGMAPGTGFVNSIGMTFRWCPAGRFTMGSKEAAGADTRDRQPVQVVLSKGFWMGEHEVTQREYKVVMNKTVPATFTTHKNAPFWGVAEAKQITDCCKKLNDLERKAGRLPNGWEYVCPTEAEWEYACRAGSTAAFCFGDSVSDLGGYGNFADNALRTENPNCYWAEQQSDDGVGEALAPVGSYLPNAWGLRDMHGNVAEVVADHLLPELPGGTDPLARVEKDGRTQIRGGAWCSLPLYCESSFRNAAPGRDKFNFVGFRVALKKVK